MYYFLREDFDGLIKEIAKIALRMKELGKEVGQSCKEGAETFHDNFALEDSHRQQRMWSTRLKELSDIRNQARVIDPPQKDKVALGVTVTIEDENTGETRVMKIGSFMVFDDKDGSVISYAAPLARMIIGGKVGETKEAIIAGTKRVFNITKIE